ncbi:MAG: methylmalonyl Co-A mutase-associated GTPase MeaB [Deferribacteraceae bacterium]|jgi:LAO/AO transport system kinase|nr:methylmalonyl Co-A mutase-associated GTPase MeaB [Deferribacteraceae bacterium]
MSLADRAIAGEVRAAARLMRIADDRTGDYIQEMVKIWAHTGHARIIGITGAPGSGKSTLTDALITHYRSLGKSVGVAAVDPSSPFSGGAILGDRIRMATHANDEGVFIRSVATRGHLGGLSVSAMDIAAIFDAMGKDIIIIETVGVGQDEVDISSLADTCIVVVMPGAGDDIQAIKAGILEVADIFVVNKADRDGADRTARDLKTMLELGAKRVWMPPVVKTIALKKSGIEELAEGIALHSNYSDNEDKHFARLYHAALGLLKDRLVNSCFTPDRFRELLKTQGDPYSVTIKWLKNHGLEA